MATISEEQMPVATPAQPVVAAAPAVPLSTAVNPADVYSPTNIQQIGIPSTKKAMDMKLSDLEKRLSKANSIEELNQISIMNQPKAMGVLTGEAAYRSKLDTARINAFNSLYNNRLLEEQRKQAERDAFKAEWGVDPSTRPKGMSKREFEKSLRVRGVMPVSEYNQQKMKLDLAGMKKSLAGTNTASDVLSVVGANLQRGPGGYVDYANYSTAKDQAIKTGKITGADFDATYGSMLSPDDQKKFAIGLTPIQAQAKPKTQAQLLAAGYATRTQESNNIINNLENYASKANPLTFGIQGLNKYPSFLQSSEFRQYDQAARNFINAVLRRESGAAIAQSEFESAYKQYLPKPRDDNKVLEQKRKNREMVIQSLIEAGGDIYGSGQSQMSDEEAYAEYLKLKGQ